MRGHPPMEPVTVGQTQDLALGPGRVQSLRPAAAAQAEGLGSRHQAVCPPSGQAQRLQREPVLTADLEQLPIRFARRCAMRRGPLSS